jgi:hypothetical protein
LAELQLDGQSNFGFQPDDWNCDSVSRYTASTEIADDKDNNKSSNNSPTNNNDNGAKAKTKTEKPKKKKEGIVTEDNTKHEDKAQTSMVIGYTSISYTQSGYDYDKEFSIPRISFLDFRVRDLGQCKMTFGLSLFESYGTLFNNII